MNQHSLKTVLSIVAAAIGVFVVAGVYYFWNESRITQIASFEDCASAGYPVMESYPPQCKTPDGRTFVQKVATPAPVPPGVSSERGASQTPKSAQKQTPSPTLRTYDNGKYGFQIRYPANMQLFEKEERLPARDQYSFYNTTIAWLWFLPHTPDSLAIILREHELHKSLGDYQRVIVTFSHPQYRLTQVNGTVFPSGASALWIVDEWLDSGRGKIKTYVFPSGNKFLTFSFPAASPNAATFEQIIQTIIFTR